MTTSNTCGGSKRMPVIQTRGDIDWTLTTWEGSRRESLRRWRRLTLRAKLQAVEDMGDLANHFREQRLKRGQPIVVQGALDSGE